MRKEDNTFANTEAENAEGCKKHFTNLFNIITSTLYDPTILKLIPQIITNNNLGELPTTKEIRKAIQKMQYKKSPGPNGILTEAFKSLNGDGYKNIRLDYSQKLER